MDIVKMLRKYNREQSSYAEHCHMAADEIERLMEALRDANAGFSLAYAAVERGFYDEAMLHCDHHHAMTLRSIGDGQIDA